MQSQKKQSGKQFKMRRSSKKMPSQTLSDKTLDAMAMEATKKFLAGLTAGQVNILYKLHQEKGEDHLVNTLLDTELKIGKMIEKEALSSLTTDNKHIKEHMLGEDYESDLLQPVNEVKEAKEFKCVLCDTCYSSKQKLRSHYENTCDKKSLMDERKTKNFGFVPNSVSKEEVDSIMEVMMDFEADDLYNLEEMLIVFLGRQYMEHHIESNNNIYIGNKEYDRKFYIIANGKWVKEGTLNVLQKRIVELFKNLSKYVEEGISGSTDKEELQKKWDNIKKIFADNRAQVYIAKLMYNDTYKNEDILLNKYDNTFQY